MDAGVNSTQQLKVLHSFKFGIGRRISQCDTSGHASALLSMSVYAAVSAVRLVVSLSQILWNTTQLPSSLC